MLYWSQEEIHILLQLNKKNPKQEKVKITIKRHLFMHNRVCFYDFFLFF